MLPARLPCSDDFDAVPPAPLVADEVEVEVGRG